MKRTTFGYVALLLLITGCNLPDEAQPTLALTSTTESGGVVTLNNVSVTIPSGLATNALSEMIAAATDPNMAPWEMAPAHLELTLTGYQLQNKLHQPKIYVYQADEYAQVNNAAAESIGRLRRILSGAPLSTENMLAVPFFNATPIIAAQMQPLAFQNGSGVRMVTQYAQYLAPVNNYELNYQFQGLTSDDKYYIVAILPVAAPILAETDKPDAPIPAGGVSIPADTGPNGAYYTAITEGLNALSPDAFRPSLAILDSMIQSMQVINP